VTESTRPVGDQPVADLPAADRPGAGRPDGGQPRVRHNDYGTLSLPALGEWEPRLPVSVVIPAYGGQQKLDLTLASLAAQSYPSHLLEVVVVDDGSAPPLRLPEIVPERVRLVDAAGGGKWGRAHACHTGATRADGDVIHWLDADMVVFDEHVEAQMRWHHLADYLVVLGYKRFVDISDDGMPTPQAVFDAVSSGSAEKLFDLEESERHEWIEKIFDATDRLRRHGSRSYRVHVGATASVPSRLLWSAGGMNDSLVLGEDTELGYRLAQQGAVFVPDPEARSWHLGPSTVMRRRDQVNRHNEPYLSQRVPLPRQWRRVPGRQWLVPLVDVVVDAREPARCSYEELRATIGAALASVLPDVGVTVVGPWSELGDERRAPLDDPLLDLRLTRDAFAHDGRVTFVEEIPKTSAPAPFRFICPPGWAPTTDAFQRLADLAASEDLGVILLAIPDGSDLVVARFERTAAVARALAVREAGEEFDDVIDEIYGSHWIDGTEWALVPAKDAEAETVPVAQQIAKLRRQAERWEAETKRLKRKLQAPISRKLLDAARRALSRLVRAGRRA
jgi:GT2 family glycosyltransferase